MVLWEQGYSDMEISRYPQVNMTRRSVYTWTKRFAEATGKADEELVMSQARSGAPKKAATPIRKKIIKKVQNKRKQSLRKTVAWLKSLGIYLSKNTLARILKRDGMYPYRRHKQPLLKPTQKEKRVKFAKKFKTRNWLKTLMTDEKDFNLFTKSNTQNDRVWAHDPSVVPPVELVKGGGGVKVWAGVSATGRTKLHF
jgi:transposase